MEQSQRTIWRAIHWAIKSRMEAVSFGIETFEEAFLSHFEMGVNGVTIGEMIVPMLQKGMRELPLWKNKKEE